MEENKNSSRELPQTGKVDRAVPLRDVTSKISL